MRSRGVRRGRAADQPTDRQIARAYLRIAHIYRAGNILNLAAEYYDLVIARFPDDAELAARARLWRARCLAAANRPGAARRHLRAVVRDPATASALRCHAALRLLRLAVRTQGPRGAAKTRGILLRRLREGVAARRLVRWVRLADRIAGEHPSGRSMVAEA